MKAMLTIPVLVLLIAGWRTALAAPSAEFARPETPDFGPHVLIFDPSMTDMQRRIDEIFRQQERSQFGSNRYALFFKPGKYDLDVQVGFYTQVLGLGRTPDDLAITGAVRCKARWMANNNATCNFYQSEMPYDPPSQEAWKHGEVNGYASYKVADTVTSHEAWGLGVYCVFHAAPVVAENAIETPTVPGVKMHHMVTIRLGGRPNSGINHVINGKGSPVITTRKAVVD